MRVSFALCCCLIVFHSTFGCFIAAPTFFNTKMPRTRRQQQQQPPVEQSLAASALNSPDPKKRGKSSSAKVTPSPKKKRKQAKSTSPTKKSSAPSSSPPTTPTALTSSQVAAVAPDSPFVDLDVSPAELRPSATLTTGQCFHWRVVEQDKKDERVSSENTATSAWGTHDSVEWVGTLRVFNPTNKSNDDSFVVSVKETPETTLYRVLYAPPHVTNDVGHLLRNYFQLHTPLKPLYQEWSKADVRLKRIAECIPGVRIMEQDPWECLVSFICSSNNNIPRITKMLAAIRESYGEPLVTIGKETFYSFPSLQQLRSKATDAAMREIGLGYRSKYLMQTMEILHELGGEKYLHKLREINDPAAVQDALCQFCGVGAKVADCTALFSLRQVSAVPVDVHVWDIALRDYDTEGVLMDVKSMTPTIYKQVGDLFRCTFPQYTGWAHSLLFVAELPSFRPALPQDIVDEMVKFRGLEQAKKEAAREAKRQKKKAAS